MSNKYTIRPGHVTCWHEGVGYQCPHQAAANSSEGVQILGGYDEKVSQGFLCYPHLIERLNDGRLVLNEGEDKSASVEGFARRRLIEHQLGFATSLEQVSVGQGLPSGWCQAKTHEGAPCGTKWQLDGQYICSYCLTRKLQAGELHVFSVSAELEAAFTPSLTADISHLEVQW